MDSAMPSEDYDVSYALLPLSACDPSGSTPLDQNRGPALLGSCAVTFFGGLTSVPCGDVWIQAMPTAGPVGYVIPPSTQMVLLRVPNMEAFKGDTKTPEEMHVNGVDVVGQQLGDASRKERFCAACGRVSRAKKALLRCPCHTVYYCDGTCQRTHWYVSFHSCHCCHYCFLLA
jgi:hypothetical protein